MDTNKRIVLVLLVVVLVGIGATAAFYLADLGGSGGSRSLPSNCVKPEGGFLVIASDTGYNDSMGHGAPEKSWPILTVTQGQNVTVVVCNIDVQPHGFQITHYWDASDGHSQVTLSPGQVYTVSFVASKQGSFDIYCEIFCTVHVYMQSGLLNVTAS